MVLFVMLLITLFILAVFTVVAVGIGGAAFIIVFSDVIVCVFLMVWILRFFFKRHRRR
ncbi:MAG: hypothetical protein HFF83_07510 [Oscillibacter sp.]|jgi:hypothetical protein|nr:hypothetical protein [Oscillibacter sp.]